MVGTRNVQGVPPWRGVARRRVRSPSLWGVGLARGACRRLLRNALGAAKVIAVALGGGEGRDRRPTWGTRQSLCASDTVAQLY